MGYNDQAFFCFVAAGLGFLAVEQFEVLGRF